jgi:hypothetical protein
VPIDPELLKRTVSEVPGWDCEVFASQRASAEPDEPRVAAAK